MAFGEGGGFHSITRKDIDVGCEIASGRFKRVHRGIYKQRDAVIVTFARESEGNVQNELELLLLLAEDEGRQCIPEVLGICHDGDATLVVQELAPWGSLCSAIRHADIQQHVTPLHRLYCCPQLASALEFLNKHRVVHADLSCRNVLLCFLDCDPANVVVKITDFGLSMVVPFGETFVVRRQDKAIRWCAPEVIAFKRWSHSSDVWALGATYWELFEHGVHPWAAFKQRAEVKQRLKEIAVSPWSDSTAQGLVWKEFPCPATCPPQLHSVLLSCLELDETKRPLAAKVVAETMNVTKGQDEKTGMGRCPVAVERQEADIVGVRRSNSSLIQAKEDGVQAVGGRETCAKELQEQLCAAGERPSLQTFDLCREASCTQDPHAVARSAICINSCGGA